MDNGSICFMKPSNPLLMAQTWKFFHSHFSWCQTVKSDTGQHSQFLRCLGHPFWSVLYDPITFQLSLLVWTHLGQEGKCEFGKWNNCTILFLYYPYHDINFRAHQMVSGNLTNMSIWNKLQSTRFSAKFMTCTNLDKAGGQIVKYKYVFAVAELLEPEWCNWTGAITNAISARLFRSSWI